MYKDEFKSYYWVWIEHKEALPPENQFGIGYVGSSSTGVHVGNEKGGNVSWEDNLSHYQEMIFDAAGHEFRKYFEPSEKVPNSNNKRFYNLLEVVNRPL